MIKKEKLDPVIKKELVSRKRKVSEIPMQERSSSAFSQTIFSQSISDTASQPISDTALSDLESEMASLGPDELFYSDPPAANTRRRQRRS